ncbi:hypothetical protein LXA43DRAFT_1004645, partial [Ganoderma leucocontextum]
RFAIKCRAAACTASTASTAAATRSSHTSFLGPRTPPAQSRNLRLAPCTLGGDWNACSRPRCSEAEKFPTIHLYEQPRCKASAPPLHPRTHARLAPDRDASAAASQSFGLTAPRHSQRAARSHIYHPPAYVTGPPSPNFKLAMQFFSTFLTAALIALATTASAVPLGDVASQRAAYPEPLLAINSPAAVPTQKPHAYMRRARAHP